MKMKTNISFKLSTLVCIILLLSLMGCSDSEYGQDVIIVTGTESNPVVKFVVEDTPSTYTVTASASAKVDSDVSVSFAIDDSAVEQYNTKNKTNYYSIPASAVELEKTEDVIKAGTAASTGVAVRVISTEDMVDGRSYIIPVSIRSISGSNMQVLEASRTIFLRISRVINFNSLDISNSNIYSNFIFPDNKAVDLPNFTYEIKCYANSFHRISRLCSFTAKDEKNSSMLRFGENGQPEKSLQWVCPGGSVVSKTEFSENKWYLISLTFDGSKYTMYVDGVKDAELAGTTVPTFQRFELGMSWEGYPSVQYFNGRVAEARVWNRALTTSELQMGMCGVDPRSNGLVAYWKFNEGEGHIFNDVTGNGYDMDWSKTVRDNTGNGTLNPFDKSQYVQWIFDDKNKCNQ